MTAQEIIGLLAFTFPLFLGLALLLLYIVCYKHIILRIRLFLFIFLIKIRTFVNYEKINIFIASLALLAITAIIFFLLNNENNQKLKLDREWLLLVSASLATIGWLANSYNARRQARVYTVMQLIDHSRSNPLYQAHKYNAFQRYPPGVRRQIKWAGLCICRLEALAHILFQFKQLSLHAASVVV